ncbi:MAG: hypothetical protein EZS28_016780 [Streblomastix strix]|uniref:Uncharacterized protein n=1 Tax=Streblomastix strix TaxID=222440 RepID=A0A5J4VYN0_9EUKA|nr:MAG: hypothetical protein EZS28_016780 [Streblomastix strix]
MPSIISYDKTGNEDGDEMKENQQGDYYEVDQDVYYVNERYGDEIDYTLLLVIQNYDYQPKVEEEQDYSNGNQDMIIKLVKNCGLEMENGLVMEI